MPAPPTGTVTFLFTDIEGSTHQWDSEPEAMRLALSRHDMLIRGAVEQHNGYLYKTTGDGFCAAFHTALDGLKAACAAQRMLHLEQWADPIFIKVRMALHTGAVEHRDNDYFGPALNRSARLLAVGHGGQVLLSHVTQGLCHDVLPTDCSFRNLSEHCLRDLNRPELVFQLLVPDLPSEFPPLKSQGNPSLPNNLPQQVSSFVGRQAEIENIKALLEKNRLVTITGSGGCGKTRVSLQVAAEVLEHYPEGAWFVELAALADGERIPQAIASVLGIKELPGRPLLQTLTDSLKSKQLLLVFDNCEHLRSDCARLTSILLKACGHVKVLSTSREKFGVAGEQTFDLPSLTVPNLNHLSNPATVIQSEAVHLFIERAVLVDPDFKVDSQNIPSLAYLCCRLDGIPLAIELAAARVHSLSVDEINRRLDNCLRLLTGGDQTALPRQQTLQATIDWSYDLLKPQEKLVLECLSVFVGGWTMDTAEQVCGGYQSAETQLQEEDLLDILTSLVDKSLVIAERQRTAIRYRLLETVRQHAAARLIAHDGVDKMKNRHLNWCIALGEEAEAHLTGLEQRTWMERLETEHANIRAALAWCETCTTRVDAGLRLAGALWRFWEVRGHFSEGRDHLERLLRQETVQANTLSRARALNGAGALADNQGDHEMARQLFEKSRDIFGELGDSLGNSRAIHNLGLVAFHQGQYDTARSLYEMSLTTTRKLEDRWGVAVSLSTLGNLAYHQGKYADAQPLYEESLAIRRELGNRRGIASSLYNLGNVAYAQGDYIVAQTLQEESVVICRELGDKWGIARALTVLGNVAYLQGDYLAAQSWYGESLIIYQELGDKRGVAESFEGMAPILLVSGNARKAVYLFSAAESLRKKIGAPLPPNEQQKYEQCVTKAQVALGKDAFLSTWQAGRTATWEQAASYALNETAA
ncbi:MAG: putative ATPase [Chthonomonadaceae bacterium]|nr:putative ATPase [Chthonomonadaceae bacterium]